MGRTETDLYRDRLDEQGRAALYDGAYVQRSRPMSPGPGQLAEAARPDDVA